jgi:transposase
MSDVEKMTQKSQEAMQAAAELAEAVRGPAPEGDEWLGRTVAEWIAEKLGRPVHVQLGWVYLVRLEGKRRKPRPRHVQADPAEQEQFKKR